MTCCSTRRKSSSPSPPAPQPRPSKLLQTERNYGEALRVIAALRPSIDDFFDKVMVMAPGDDIRANRLTLLSRTLNDLSRIADFSEIVVAARSFGIAQTS